jgi:hypothetical protein
VTAATRLIVEDGDFGGWPPGWKDEHGKVRLECAVLQRVPSLEKIHKYAVMLNQHTGALVETSYLDVLETIRTARAAVLASAPADTHAAPNLTRGMKAKIVDMSNSVSKLTPGTIRKALGVLLRLEGRGIMVMIRPFQKWICPYAFIFRPLWKDLMGQIWNVWNGLVFRYFYEDVV